MQHAYLDLGVVVQHVLAALAADARLLVPTKRHAPSPVIDKEGLMKLTRVPL